ncbi:MAG TPA: DUF881 domain-containing protein [Actinomycetota bacterium]|nr:DUF881 domain-containing protein [Actinomycetota bacterium]
MEAPSPRITVAVAAAVLGFLAVLAARQPPLATREIRRLELADLIRAEDARVRRIRAEVRTLQAEVAGLGTVGAEVRALRAEARSVAAAAGAAAVEGPGIEVTLDDSSARRSPTGDPNDLIVHERDIQTVVNALWAAGADAVGVNGERLSSTSAVRCAGNTLLLHGALHSPPYRIAAIGDPGSLADGLSGQPGMDRLRDSVQAFGLGLDIDETSVRLAGTPPAGSFEAAQPRGGR